MGGVDSGVSKRPPSAHSPDLRHGVDGSGARVTMSFQLWQRQDPGRPRCFSTRTKCRGEKQQKTQQKRPKSRGNQKVH